MSLARSIALATARLVEPVEGMHRSISGRWFRAFGPLGRPIRSTHDAVARLVYGSIRLTGAVVGAGLEARRSGTAAADRTIAVVNGLWDEGSHVAMTLRDADGTPVDTDADLADRFPDATGRVVVLVHGLIETERVWTGTRDRPGLLSRLRVHPSLTPVTVRYASGRSIDESGSQLAELLEQLHHRWPVGVQSIALVGNSMGGLVVRSAREAGHRAEHRWATATIDVVTLGAPHRGTPLEKLANATAQCLRVAPDTRPLAVFLDRRSRGIKDLRYGTSADADGNRDRGDALRRDAHPGTGVRQHFVAATVTRNPGNPAGAILGDLVVRVQSATGGHSVRPDRTTVLGGITHFSLPDDPTALDTIIDWLDPPSEGAEARFDR